MLHRQNTTPQFVSVCICVVIKLVHSEATFLKSVGPKFCDRFCSNTVGCYGYIYKRDDLTCNITGFKTVQEVPDEDRNLLKVVKIPVNCELLGQQMDKESECARNFWHCLKHWKIFYSRRRHRLCRNSWPRLKLQKEMMNILILVTDKLARRSRILNTQSNTIGIYASLKGIYQAVIYISANNKLLVSSLKPRELFLTPLYSRQKTIITKIIHVHGMAVDETEQSVFLASSVLTHNVYVMTTEGSDLTPLTRLDTRPLDVAADTRRKMIYVSFLNHYIAKFTYQGRRIGVIHHGKTQRTLSLNPVRDVLYYIRDSIIYEMSLFDMTQKNIVQIPNATTVLSFQEKIYITVRPYERPNIILFENRIIKRLRYYFGNCQLWLCPIP